MSSFPDFHSFIKYVNTTICVGTERTRIIDAITFYFSKSRPEPTLHKFIQWLMLESEEDGFVDYGTIYASVITILTEETRYQG